MNKIKSLTDEQIVERVDMCMKKKLCFISLQPLDFADDGTKIQHILKGIAPIVHKKYLKTYYEKS